MEFYNLIGLYAAGALMVVSSIYMSATSRAIREVVAEEVAIFNVDHWRLEA